MNGPTGKRGAAYVRVSDGDKQDPEAQRVMIRNWAAKRKAQIARWAEDIEGRNPRDRSDKRKDFQKLIAEVQAGKWDWIVVDSQDRWGVTDPDEWGFYATILKRNDCELWSVDQSQGKNGLLTSGDTGAVFATTVKAVSSSEELKEYGKRQVSRKREKAAKGEWQGGYIPYGFDAVCLDRNTGKEVWRVVLLNLHPQKGIWHRIIVHHDGRQVRCDGKDTFPVHQQWEVLQLAPSLIEDRVATVREIFELFASGAWSVRGLASRLNARKIDPVTGEGWYHTRLTPLLRNPLYHVGHTVWGKKSHGKNAWYVGGEYLIPPKRRGKALTGRKNNPADWVFPPSGTAIVTKDLWDEVQARLDGRPEIKRGLRDDRLWLAGLLVCDRCGQKMTGWSQAGLFYACTTYRKFGKSNSTGCRLHRVQQARVETEVNRYLDDIGPAVKALLETDGEPALLGELHERLSQQEEELFAVYARMREYLESEGIRADWDEVPVADVYRDYHTKHRAKLERQLQTATNELKNLIANLNRIPEDATTAHGIQRNLIAEADKRVKELKDHLAPLEDRLNSVYDDLAVLDKSLEEAREAIPGDDARRKALALRKVVREIRLHFRHFDHRPKDRRTKAENLQRSALSAVEFVPVCGNPVSYRVGAESFNVDSGPGRG